MDSVAAKKARSCADMTVKAKFTVVSRVKFEISCPVFEFEIRDSCFTVKTIGHDILLGITTNTQSTLLQHLYKLYKSDTVSFLQRHFL